MQSVNQINAIAVPFGAANIDTDAIIPARYLKTVSRTGLGEGAFVQYRTLPGNIFDVGRARGAEILIAGANFGCGSSREHAAWALLDLGYRVVIAPSFADIFASNAFKNGIILVTLPQEQVDRLMTVAGSDRITIDLENQVVTTPFQDRFSFEIDPFRKHCLLNGLDEIALTEALDDKIAHYETALGVAKPWVGGAAQRSGQARSVAPSR